MEPHQELYLIGNAHIDPVWLWRWQEGYAEIKATFRSALDRLDEFPGFVFTSACAAYYAWVEESDPGMFDEIRRRVAEGRWQLAGGMWIQPDCNIPSGESLARHLLYSQSYFLQRFGRRAVTGYNVDTFGHAGTLPKLLAAAGIKNYVMMRPDAKENPDIPGFLFWWQAADGSRVLTYRIPNGYLTPGRPSPPEEAFEDNPAVAKLRDTQRIADAAGLPAMHFYGVGNHGGGPTVATLRLYDKARAMPGGKRLRYAGPDEYFDAVRGAGYSPAVWGRELQHHASLCYSAHSEVKLNNRLAENRLAAAEVFGVMAEALLGRPANTAALDKAWRAVLFNQFHDTMGGCAIPEAYTDARQLHGEALSLAAESANASVQGLSWAVDTSGGLRRTRSKESDWALWELQGQGTPVVVFNPRPWPREIPVQIGRPVAGATDEEGRVVPVQRVRASRTNGADKWDALFVAQAPAMGWRTYWVYLEEEKPAAAAGTLRAGPHYMENDHLRLEIDAATGAISGLHYKALGANLLSGPGAVPIVIDVEHADTWAHGLFSFRDEAGRFGGAQVRLLESGPVRARIRVTSHYGSSALRQDFMLYAGARQVEVAVQLDWRERHRLLKLSFPVAAENAAACYDAPFGHTERPAAGTEEPGQMWFDLTGTSGGRTLGLAVLNSGKYSFDVLDGEMRMTVANGSMYADHYAGEHRDDMAEYLDQGIQAFGYALLPHAGGWQDAGVVQAAVGFNTEEYHVAETYHEGPLPQRFEGIHIEAGNVVATALKPACDGDGAILRLYETAGRPTACRVALRLPERSFTAEMPAYGIKSYRIPQEPGQPVAECDLTEAALP